MDGRSEGLRRVAVEGVQDLGLDLRDGVAVEDLDLHLLLVLLGVHGQRLRRGETRERGRERVSIKSNNNGFLSANYSLYSLIFSEVFLLLFSLFFVNGYQGVTVIRRSARGGAIARQELSATGMQVGVVIITDRQRVGRARLERKCAADIANARKSEDGESLDRH